MSHSCLFWAGVGGGTAHYRCVGPGAALARAGWKVAFVEDDDTNFAGFDIVVLQRVLAPGIPDLIRGLQSYGTKVVVDLDDLYDQVPVGNPYAPGPDHLRLLHASMDAADLITVTTQQLAEVYCRFGRTVVLENYLDPAVWQDALRFRTPREDGRVTVGWVGEASARRADLALLEPWLNRFLEKRSHVDFCLAGSPPEALGRLGLRSGFVTEPQPNGSHLRPYEELPRMLAAIDVGLVPLTLNPFNNSKSWIKGLEYGACGIPVIASPSREYRTYVEPGVNGQFARRDWEKRIDTVIGDLDGYSRRARQVAERYFIDQHIGRWVAAYEAVLDAG